MTMVIFAIYIACMAWVFHCINVTLEERLAIINYVYSIQGSEDLIRKYEATSSEKHLWYRLTFRKPPYLDLLTGVEPW